MKRMMIALVALTLLATPALAVSRDEAEAIAQSATGGAEVARVERDGGVYEIELRGGDARYEVKVLSATGAVLEVEAAYPGARGSGFALTEEEARNAAAAVAPEAAGGLVTRERGGEGDAYEVLYASGGAAGEVLVNAETGAILGAASYPEAAARGVLRPDEVEGRLAERLPGAQLVELELEWDDGRYVYEGEAATKEGRYSFEIDAQTGAVLEIEREN